MGGKSAKLTEEEVSDLEANQNIRCKISVSSWHFHVIIFSSVCLVDKKEIRELWNGWKYDLEQHGVELRPGELPGLPKKAFIKNFGQVTIFIKPTILKDFVVLSAWWSITVCRVPIWLFKHR